MHDTSTNMMVISPKETWKLLVYWFHLSAKVDKSVFSVNLKLHNIRGIIHSFLPTPILSIVAKVDPSDIPSAFPFGRHLKDTSICTNMFYYYYNRNNRNIK